MKSLYFSFRHARRARRPVFRRRYWCLPVLCPLLAFAAAAQDVIVTIDDPSPTHVHPVGQTFIVSVSVSDPGVADADIRAQWLDPEGQPLATPVTLAPGQPRSIVSPDSRPGHYDLRFTSGHPEVRFAPQDAGFHLDFGFAIMPTRSVADRTLDDDSFFGMIHANRADPYLRGWIKTLTWNTATPVNFAQKIKDFQQQDRLQELPMITGVEWDTDHDVPITDAQLDTLGNRFGTYLDALQDAGVHVPAWQFGREENRNGQFEQAHFFANLERKVERLRAELDQRGLQDVAAVFSMRGFNYDYFTAFASSDAAAYFEVLGFHPYKWNDFPSPETEDEWLRNHIETVHQIMLDHGGPSRLWMTEFGIPHQGNNNPAGFFGYPASGAVVDGGSRAHAARYIVKSHVISLATGLVEKIFFYNYHDRDNDNEYAEDHFGLRMHAALTNSGDATLDGHTKPAYVAYMTMVDQLDRMSFERADSPASDVWVYEFSDRDPASDASTIVAWTSPGGTRSVPLSDLRPGLTAADVTAVTGLYGADQSLDGSHIALGPQPVFVRLGADTGVPDHLPVANDDSASTDQDTSVIVAVLGNDAGLEDMPIAISIVGAPAHGDAMVLADNAIEYTPGAGYSGTDTFAYRVSDGDGDQANATVFVTIVPAPVEPPPLPSADIFANPTLVDVGGFTTLGWQTNGADMCTAGGDWSGDLATSGERVLGPLLADSRFELICTGAGGTAGDAVDVTVLIPMSDSDGDGLADDWERAYFGDLSQDGGADPDEDDALNATEFAYGTNPTDADSDGDGARDGDEIAYGSDPGSAHDNWQDRRPDQPLLQGDAGPVAIRGHVIDVVHAFSDPDQDTLLSVDWQIGADPAFAELVLSRNINHGTALRAPAGILTTAQTYHVRTRHWDSTGLPSLWSEPIAVTTVANDSADLDADGTVDDYQVSVFTDVDDNGVEDNSEAGMCTLYDAQARRVIGIRADRGEMRCVTALSSGDVPVELRTSDAMPYGLLAFQVRGLPINASTPAAITATIFLPDALAAGAEWYLYDETAHEFSPYGGVVDQQGGRISIRYVDGGPGDKDGLVNGVIVDPIGPVVAQANSTPNPDPGGATVTNAAAPDGGGGGAANVAVLVAILLIPCCRSGNDTRRHEV